MNTTPDYIQENQLWLERLEQLLSQLSDQDLTRPMEAGWTVSSVLAHMAFWDIRVVTLLQKWQNEGTVSASAIDSGVVNEVTRLLFLSIPPRTAAEMALDWARRANQTIAATSPELAAEIRLKEPNVRLDRAHHRKAHIDDIHKALGW